MIEADETAIPRRLLRRLDDLGTALSKRGDAIALIALGSVGLDVDRLDDHSDLDFFVIVDDGAKQRYIDSVDWLEAARPIAFSFPNTVDGRKALFDDGLFAEYAVFTVDELVKSAFSPGRIVWQRADAPDGLAVPRRPAGASPTLDHQVCEALTNLYVGLHRDARGEKLAAARLIQTHAVDRVITLFGLLEPGKQQDPFAVERGVEARFAGALPLAAMVPGYERNREAAAAILRWLEAHADVDPVMADAVRELVYGR